MLSYTYIFLLVEFIHFNIYYLLKLIIGLHYLQFIENYFYAQYMNMCKFKLAYIVIPSTPTWLILRCLRQ